MNDGVLQKLLARMKFRHKVMLLPAVAALFLLALVTFSQLLSRGTEARLERLERGFVPALELSRDAEGQLALVQRALLDAVTAEDPDALAEVDRLAAQLHERLEQQRKSPDVPPGRVDALEARVATYVRLGRSAAAHLIAKDPAAEAELPQMTEAFVEAERALREATGEDRARMAAAFDGARGAHRSGRVATTVVGLLCLAALALASLWLVRQVAGPLQRLTRVARRIATDGDLAQEVELEGHDELGELARSIRQMVERLRDVPLQLGNAVSELSLAAQNITELTRAQAHVLQRQARSLEEARSAMQEIGQTSAVASAQAETVLQVATQAEDFSAAGQASLEGSAHGLQQIRDQVGTLVRTVAGLSTQAVKAGEIVSSVKDLADQSNILALNAAIEAARAGEHGTGFAVVASEMRSLSGQSLQSTQRINAILSDINRAIRQAVQIAEADSQKMELGIGQVLSFSDTLREMAAVVQQSSQAARQIVSSVTQQNAGITQMRDLVGGLGGMMDEISASTRRGEAAIEQLNATLGRIQGIVGGFRF